MTRLTTEQAEGLVTAYCDAEYCDHEDAVARAVDHEWSYDPALGVDTPAQQDELAAVLYGELV